MRINSLIRKRFAGLDKASLGIEELGLGLERFEPGGLSRFEIAVGQFEECFPLGSRILPDPEKFARFEHPVIGLAHGIDRIEPGRFGGFPLRVGCFRCAARPLFLVLPPSKRSCFSLSCPRDSSLYCIAGWNADTVRVHPGIVGARRDLRVQT